MSDKEDDEPVWLISVKTVGAERQSSSSRNNRNNENNNNNNEGGGGVDSIPPTFDVRVKPSDNVQSLHDRIETVTGLKESQQRLIYRGRLIQSYPTEEDGTAAATTTAAGNSTTNSEISGNHPNHRHNSSREPTKISEIKGLADGHTIHLVRRQETPSSSGTTTTSTTTSSSTNGTSATATARSRTSENEGSNSESSNSSSGSATSSLLAALLGLSALDEEPGGGGGGGGVNILNSNNNNNNSNGGGRSSPQSRPPWRRARRSRPSYRLTAEDLEVPDPGSMESVRQGLMTLHTLLAIAESQRQQPALANEDPATTNQGEGGTAPPPPPPPPHPMAHNRRWYLGQWIDVRDTVNQWLEATIVEIVRPEEILPASAAANSDNAASSSSSSSTDPTIIIDPAVSTSDLEGRRRLLLEPCEVGEPGDLGGELEGFRPRSSNQNVLLLQIHYNGWPHRWDEWIRSDSERIRPFRVRTRHPTTSPWISPTTQTPYAQSPNTYLGGEQSSDVQDRSYLLHELLRVTTAVNALAQQAVDALPPPPPVTTPSQDQPWRTAHPDASSSTPAAGGVGTNTNDDDDDDGNNNNNIEGQEEEGEDEHEDSNALAVETNNEPSGPESATPTSSSPSSSPSRENPSLDMLAPLIDRLGRILVDAAPHIASLAASQRNKRDEEDTTGESNRAAEEGTTNDGGSPETATGSGAEPSSSNNSSSNSLGGLLSLLNRERSRRDSRTSQSQSTDQALSPVSEDAVAAADTNGRVASSSAPSAVDPDYTDFASGLVNTTRGEVRSGPRSSRNSGSAGGRDDISGLLGAYLAAASLGGLTSFGSDDDDGNSDMQGLGRLLRSQGGNGENGGGIDIHIHAVVTAPGMSPTGGGGGTALALGLGGLGGFGTGGLTTATTTASPTTTTTAAATDLFSNTRRAAERSAQRIRATLLEQQSDDDNDMGIFDDLYSENPNPVSPSSTEGAGSSSPEGGGEEANPSSTHHREPRHHHSSSATAAAHSSRSLSSSSRRNSSRRQASQNLNGSSHGSSNHNNNNNNNNNHRPSFFGRLFRRNGSTE